MTKPSTKTERIHLFETDEKTETCNWLHLPIKTLTFEPPRKRKILFRVRTFWAMNAI